VSPRGRAHVRTRLGHRHASTLRIYGHAVPLTDADDALDRDRLRMLLAAGGLTP
jgi:hypothetical protein